MVLERSDGILGHLTLFVFLDANTLNVFSDTISVFVDSLTIFVVGTSIVKPKSNVITLNHSVAEI